VNGPLFGYKRCCTFHVDDKKHTWLLRGRHVEEIAGFAVADLTWMLAIPVLKSSKILLRCGFAVVNFGRFALLPPLVRNQKVVSSIFSFWVPVFCFSVCASVNANCFGFAADIYGSQAMQLTNIIRQVSVEVEALWLLLLDIGKVRSHKI
jgi:hypothetical protein